MKFESCVSCWVCFYHHDNSCTLCENCNGEDAFVPITEHEIQEMDLALKTEDSKLRYYLDLNPVLTKSIDNSELTIVN